MFPVTKEPGDDLAQFFLHGYSPKCIYYYHIMLDACKALYYAPTYMPAQLADSSVTGHLLLRVLSKA